MEKITLNFSNYKLMQDKEIELKDSYIYFIKGGNNKGKTTVKNAMRAALEVLDDTKEPVTNGQEEGSITYRIPGADGRMYTVIYTFTNDKKKFVAIDEAGKRIDKVTDIRNIFKYTHFEASEFVQWSKTAEGRRKQFDTLLNILTEEQRKQYNTLEAYEDDYYKQRADEKKVLDVYSKEYELVKTAKEPEDISSYKEKVNKLSEQKQELLILQSKRQDISDKITDENNNIITYRTELIDFNNSNATTLRELEEELERIRKKIADTKEALVEKTKYYTNKATISKENIEKYTKQLEEIANVDTELQAINTSIAENTSIIESQALSIANWNKRTEAKEKLSKQSEKVLGLETKLDEVRTKKKEFINNSPLSTLGIEFKEGYLYLNGFIFDEKQVCTSSVYKLVAKLMVAINDCPIMIMGNAGELDNDSLRELYNFAKDNNRLMICDEVDRVNTELHVECYDLIEEDTKDVKHSFEQTSLFNYGNMEL